MKRFLSLIIFLFCFCLGTAHYFCFVGAGEEITSSLVIGLGLFSSYLGLTNFGAKARDKFVAMIAKAIANKENDNIKILLVSSEDKTEYELPVTVLRKKFGRAELGGILGNTVPGVRFDVPILALLINGSIQAVEKGEKDYIKIPCKTAELVKLREGAEAQKVIAATFPQ